MINNFYIIAFDIFNNTLIFNLYMKKLFLIICFILTLGLFGCAINDSFKDEPELTSLTGVLKEQVSTDNTLKGTHVLLVEEEKDGSNSLISYPLRSLSINLSSKNYLDNKVQVIGFKNTDDGVFEVKGISVVEALHEIEFEPEFIEYKNTDFGVQLKYYNNWKIEESEALITFNAPKIKEEMTEVDKITISQTVFNYIPEILENGEQTDPLVAYANENLKDISSPESLLNKIGPDNLNALKIEDQENEIIYYIYRNGFIYQISFIPSKNLDSLNIQTFNEMILEFKFIGFTVEDNTLGDITEDTDLTTEEEEISVHNLDISFSTFESLPFSFAGQYPASWYYAGSNGSEENVLRHYGFSTESVTSENELISLDVISEEIPSGKEITGNNKKIVVIENGETYTAYTTVESQNYRISGNKEYKDFILYITNSISHIEEIVE